MPRTRGRRNRGLKPAPLDRETPLRRYVSPLGLGPGVEECAVAVLQRANTEQSVKRLAWSLGKTFRDLLVENTVPFTTTPADIDGWWGRISHLAPNTRNSHLPALKGFFITAVDRGFMSVDPVKHIEYLEAVVLTPTPSLTREQANQLLAMLDDQAADPVLGLAAMRDGVLVRHCLQLAMRASEVGSLVFNSYQLDKGVEVVRFMGKGRTPANLAVPKSLRRRLDAFRTAYEERVGQPLRGDDPIALGIGPNELKLAARARRDQPLPGLAAETIWTRVSRRLAQIDIDGDRMGPHALRDTASVLLYDRTHDLVLCQRLLRHKSIETTRRHYLPHQDDGAARAIEAIGFDDEPEVNS